jgi:integrase
MKTRNNNIGTRRKAQTDISDVFSNTALIQQLSDEEIDSEIRQYLTAAFSDNTKRAYRGDLAHFEAWGGTVPATSAMIARYLADHAKKLSNATLSRRLVAIGHAHTAQGYPSPTDALLVRATLKGVRRKVGTAVKQAAALKYADLLKMVRKLPGLRGKRDSALLLFGFASAMRRSELVALNVEDLRFCDEGVIANIRRSKTDQDQHGRLVAVPRMKSAANRRKTRNCPVQHLENWLKAAGITSGAVFRSVNRYDCVMASRLTGQSVSLIIKQRATEAGIDAARLSGHSLRAGFVTAAAQSGASTTRIRAQTGHTSDSMLQRYIRDAELFSNNANADLWT